MFVVSGKGLCHNFRIRIASVYFGGLCAMYSPPLYREASHLLYQLVVKSGKAICGHPLNKKTVLGTGETKVVRLPQQMLLQLVGCVL